MEEVEPLQHLDEVMGPFIGKVRQIMEPVPQHQQHLDPYLLVEHIVSEHDHQMDVGDHKEAKQLLLMLFQILQQVSQHQILLQHKFNGIGEKYHE